MAKGKKESPMYAELREARRVVHERERTGQGTATPERMVKAGKDGLQTGDHGIQRVVAAPLDRLKAAGSITDREFNAGEQYRLDVHAAAIDPAAPTVDWDAIGGNFGSRVPSAFSSQRIYEARSRYRAVERRVTGLAKLILDLALVRENSLEEIGRVVFARGHERDAAVAGHAGFRVALNVLADHYGL